MSTTVLHSRAAPSLLMSFLLTVWNCPTTTVYYICNIEFDLDTVPPIYSYLYKSDGSEQCVVGNRKENKFIKAVSNTV